MKVLFFCFAFIITVSAASAQLKTTPVCPPFVVNVLEGDVSGVESDYTPGQIKKALPCYTSDDTTACGPVIAYKDRNISFYTDRDYIEVGEKYKGKMSIPIMGASRASLFKWLGHPQIKDIHWEAYQTSYGILVVHFNKAEKVNLIQFGKRTAQNIKLCE